MSAIRPTPAGLAAHRLRGRFALIVGEVGSGKTTLTARALAGLVRGAAGPIAVVDLAPSLPATHRRGGAPVGGRLAPPPHPALRYHRAPLAAPRLEGRGAHQRAALARANAERIEALFAAALAGEVDVLVVNDCSLYLQAGSPERMLGWIGRARTALVNGYYGTALGAGALSRRERAGMERLMAACDRLVELGAGARSRRRR